MDQFHNLEARGSSSFSSQPLLLLYVKYYIWYNITINNKYAVDADSVE